MKSECGPIGIFDSGYGGLTILREIRKIMPQYDYLYLGDNARTPYGTRSFDVVYEFTIQAVRYLFKQGCHLVILACNTASAKALRTIQQYDLPSLAPNRRVLGVIRPTVEVAGDISKSHHIGIMATPGTVRSKTYELEIAKLFPNFQVTSDACPMWVPLVENEEYNTPGADYFVKQEVDNLFAQQPDIDTVLLACTHYPLLYDKIRQYVPESAQVIKQGEIIAESLIDYMQRHPEIDARCTRGGVTQYLTTENASKFSEMASIFLNRPISATQIELK